MDVSWRAKAKIAIRLKDLELLSCDKNLLTNKAQTQFQICKWDTCSMYTIAHISPTKNGPEIRFINDRPLSSVIDWDLFKVLLEIGFKLFDFLDKTYG